MQEAVNSSWEQGYRVNKAQVTESGSAFMYHLAITNGNPIIECKSPDRDNTGFETDDIPC